jgi:hypothetical protein
VVPSLLCRRLLLLLLLLLNLLQRGTGTVAARDDAPLPAEVTAAMHESTMPGPAAGWKFQPLFKPQQQPEKPPRRQPATSGF